MSLRSLHTAADVAEALGQSEHYVKEKCRLREWPHCRVARGEVRFTDEHYAQVLEIIQSTPVAAPEPRLSFAPRSRRMAS